MIRKPPTAPAVTVMVSVQPADADRPAAIGLVFADGRGALLRRSGRLVGDLSREAAGFRGLLHALWLAKRFGARTVRVGCNVPEVVAMAQGAAPVPEALVGPYLQVRALVHAYKAVELAVVDDEAAGAAARVAIGDESHLADLPLFGEVASA